VGVAIEDIVAADLVYRKPCRRTPLSNNMVERAGPERPGRSP